MQGSSYTTGYMMQKDHLEGVLDVLGTVGMRSY